MRWAFLCLLGIAASVGLDRSSHGQPPHVAATEPRLPEEELKMFHLPPGFIAQLVAAEPKINKPINIAFDAAGRLWVTESVEYPFPALPGRQPKDRVKVLEDFGPDGSARKVTTFADGLNIPIGVLPVTGGALVYSIPNVYRLSDTSGAGKADRRDVVLRTYGFNDTHGMTGEFTLGFDGWVYACHGFANTSRVKGSGPNAITMTSGNVYRFQPDGSRVEYFTHGQVNPFGLAFDPLGNLYSCDCHSRPIYQLLRGAYYPSFGRPDDGLGFGPEMMQHDHGSTAIGGIAYYAASQFPKEYRDNIFVGNVVTNRINRDRLEWHGSSPRAIEMPDLLRSDDPWFRPVDIKLGPDGALYVADFYNRIIGHYEVPLNHPGRDRFRGRIWRIVYRGTDSKNPVRPVLDLTRTTTAALVKALADENLTVRLNAANQLVARRRAGGGDALLDILHSGTAFQKVHALWILERYGKSVPGISELARDKERTVRVHVMRALAEKSSWTDDLDRLAVDGLGDVNPFVQRAAADALGRHPRTSHVQPLLALLDAVPTVDTHLRHVARMALRDQFVPDTTWSELAGTRWSEKDSRLIADICPGLRSRQSAGFLLAHLSQWQESKDKRIRYAHHIARYGAAESARAVLELARGKFASDLETQASIFKAVLQGMQESSAGLEATERQWAAELVERLLTAKEAARLQEGIELAAGLRITAAQDPLIHVAKNAKAAAAQRKSALAALVSIEPRRHIELLSQMLSDPGENNEVREQAALSLAGSREPAAAAAIVTMLQTAPARLQKAIALGLAGSKQGAETLLKAISDGKASARLLQDRALEARLQQTRLPGLREQIEKLTRGLPPAETRLQELLDKRRHAFTAVHPDPQQGFKVFQKNCAICHQIKNEGAKIGPQLDGIGIRGLDRLLEDILDPNRNVDQAFRATTFNLKNGKIVTGLFLRQDGAILVIADAQGKEVRVPSDAVEERIVSQLSPMPANIADQVPESEFNDLLAFLLEQRVK